MLGRPLLRSLSPQHLGHTLFNEPPIRFRVFWGVVIGLVAAALLVAGGLNALQTALIAAALPLSVVVLVMTAGVLLSLFRETLNTGRKKR